MGDTNGSSTTMDSTQHSSVYGSTNNDDVENHVDHGNTNIESVTTNPMGSYGSRDYTNNYGVANYDTQNYAGYHSTSNNVMGSQGLESYGDSLAVNVNAGKLFVRRDPYILKAFHFRYSPRLGK
jgi:hypothetical protein